MSNADCGGGGGGGGEVIVNHALTDWQDPQNGAPDEIGTSNIIKKTILLDDIGCTQSKQCLVVQINSGPWS